MNSYTIRQILPAVRAMIQSPTALEVADALGETPDLFALGRIRCEMAIEGKHRDYSRN